MSESDGTWSPNASVHLVNFFAGCASVTHQVHLLYLRITRRVIFKFSVRDF